MRKLLLLLALTAGTSYAQKPAEMQTYFEKSLEGEEVKIPHKRISAKKIDKYRDMVWEVWKKANQSFNEPGFPELDSLGAAVKSQWTLPENLEPNAVMPFYFGYKGTKPNEGYPFFLYLHGSGPKEHEWKAGIYLTQHFKDAPSLYFVPQIPNEGQWYRWWQKSKQFAWDRVLRQTLLRNDVNPNRLYVFGISEGAYGSQRLASFYADYWAAAGPMAGGEPLKNAPVENLSNMGFCLRTGDVDKGFYRDILTRYTKEALDSLEDLYPAGFRHRVELIPGMGHHIDYYPTTPWLSLFTRKPSPKHFIWEDFEMDGIHRKGFYNLCVNERPDAELRTRYDFDVHDNVITMSVENIRYTTTQRDSIWGIEMKFNRDYEPAQSGNFTIFLNEDMVDFSLPVKVVVNGRQVFFGTVRLDVQNMLRSVATFYDPERIYPGAIDIKL